jgi:hypothetical protein
VKRGLMQCGVDGMKMKTLCRNTAGRIYKGHEHGGVGGPFWAGVPRVE